MPNQQKISQTDSPTSQRSSTRTKRGKTSAVSDEQDNETILFSDTEGNDNKTSLLQVKKSNIENGTHLPKAEVVMERSAANIVKGCLPTSFREIMFWILIFAALRFAFLTEDEMLVYVILLLAGSYIGIKVVDLLPIGEKVAEIIRILRTKNKS